MEKVRLTQLVKSVGCAAKIFPDILSEALSGINWYSNENILVNFDVKDDAGVYRLDDQIALIHTTDFFTPVVDDPFIFGQIAAANALSDIYAMGGTPLSALNIIAFPQTQDLGILRDILKGGMQKAKEANCAVIGGHSVDIPEILYGMSVTGKANIKSFVTNSGAKPGDCVILTKALGTGLLNNCIKFKGLDSGEIYEGLINSMTTLNKSASELMLKYNASACTDITGFGFAGHAMQLSKASKTGLEINTSAIPVLNGVRDAINEGLFTRGDRSNREYTKDFVIWEKEIDVFLEHIIYDPQTSGGLLICLDESNCNSFMSELNSDDARIIGKVISEQVIRFV